MKCWGLIAFVWSWRWRDPFDRPEYRSHLPPIRYVDYHPLGKW